MGGPLTDGSLTSLARLATDSGGRFTESTNDLTLGYARAQRDLGCTYTVGFYVDESDAGRVRDIKVRVKRKGLRAVHAGKYLFRTPSEKRVSMLRAAWFAPEMFQSGILRAHLFPLRPLSTQGWDAMLAVSFPVALAETRGEPARREFGVTLHRGAKLFHRFNRMITLRPDGPDVVSQPVITFLEPVKLRPGSYTLQAVLSEQDGEELHAERIEIDLPEIPKKVPFLVGPVLGRTSGPNVVITGGLPGSADSVGSEESFEPLLIQQIESPTDLVAFTQACVVGKKKSGKKDRRRTIGTVTRSLRREDDRPLGSLPDVEPVVEGEDRVHCANLLDLLPAAALEPGEYTFQTTLDPPGRAEPTAARVRFSVTVAD